MRKQQARVLRNYVRTHEEIAKIIGVSAKEVGRVERQALRKMRDRMSRDEFFVSGCGKLNEVFSDLLAGSVAASERSEMQDGI